VRTVGDQFPPRVALLLLGAASGALLGLAFPPLDLWPLALVGLVPLLTDLETLAASARRGAAGWGSRAFGAGFAAGLLLYGALLWWIVLLDAPALTIPWVRYPGTLAIVSFLALYVGLFAVSYVFVRARTGLPAPLAAGGLWTAIEILRGFGELGFPWGTLGYVMVSFLPALQIAAVAGISGVTFWIAAANGLALPLLRRDGRTRVAVSTFVLVAALPPALGALRMREAPLPRTVRVALVQPNVPNDEKWAPERRAEIFERMARLSRDGVARGAELVIWPETAAPCYLLKDREWRPWMESLAAELRTPFFVGVPDYQIVTEGSEKRVTYTNTGAFFDRAGRLAGRMDKIRLVPFGERIPFSQWVPYLAHLDFGEADFLPGKGPVVFDADGFRFGNLVCFEAIFSDLVRDYANAGADLLVNITNDSWFGAGSGAKQHENMAVARCVETGCGMARCANSGISTGVDACGRTFGETPLFVETLAVVDVPLRRGRTPFDRVGDWVAALSVAGSILAALAGFARGREVR
jgi:apolipoprotein N-acyltransferase